VCLAIKIYKIFVTVYLRMHFCFSYFSCCITQLTAEKSWQIFKTLRDCTNVIITGGMLLPSANQMCQSIINRIMHYMVIIYQYYMK